MEPQVVIPIESPKQLAGPWPRLLKIVAIATLVFCLAQVASISWFVYQQLQPAPRMPARAYVSPFERYQRIQMVMAVAMGLVDLVIAAAAIVLWKGGRGHRVMILALWLWLGIVLVNVVQYWRLGGPGTGEFAAIFALNILVVAAFPAMMLLVLREYSKITPWLP